MGGDSVIVLRSTVVEEEALWKRRKFTKNLECAFIINDNVHAALER